MRAYSPRPLTDGTYPEGHGLRTVVWFGRPRWVEEAGMRAWGFVAYDEPVPAEVLEAYGLVAVPDDGPAQGAAADGADVVDGAAPCGPMARMDELRRILDARGVGHTNGWPIGPSAPDRCVFKGFRGVTWEVTPGTYGGLLLRAVDPVEPRLAAAIALGTAPATGGA